MGNDSTYGPSLYAYLDRIWTQQGTNAAAWGRAHGIVSPTLSRWKSGSVPSLQAMQQVADALGKPVADVLVGAGVLHERDLWRGSGEQGPPTLDEALASDEAYPAEVRARLREILDSMMAVMGGEVSTVRRRKRAR